MCGILGLLEAGQLPDEEIERRAEKALAALAHRGPDDNGTLTFEGGMFGHTRLSILDLTSAGHQPMSEDSGLMTIIHNGEVYNFPELRSELEMQGYVFHSQTDTEVILNSYSAWGVESFRRLNGIFAFALLDRKANKVILVRDRFGVKPLYYSAGDKSFAFGSEIKALQEILDSRFTLDPSALHEFAYYGNNLGENTLYREVRKLLPGHFAEIDLASLKVTIEAYWSPEQIKPVAACPDPVAHTRDLLEQAVKRQLVSDVPVGIFLSGGIDSSAVTAFAARHYEGKLATYTVGFDYDRGVNELPKARLVADYFGTEHHEIHISGYELADVLDKLIDHHDLPFCDAANIPLYLLCRDLDSSTKVILQGDGGDELFGGYRRYSTLKFLRLWRALAATAATLHRSLPKSKSHYRRQRYLDVFSAPDYGEIMALLLSVESVASRPWKIFSQRFRETILESNPFERYSDCNSRFRNLDPVQRMLFTDTQIILPDIFLEKVDRSTMASGIEVRVPFLDNDLTEFAMGLPSGLKIKRGQKKWLLKQALDGIVPKEILSAPKTGFGVPFEYWIGGPLKDLLLDTLAELRSRDVNILDDQHIGTLLQQHVEGSKNNGFLLWKALNFALWLKQKEPVLPDVA